MILIIKKLPHAYAHGCLRLNKTLSRKNFEFIHNASLLFYSVLLADDLLLV
jgi:hypothetical protein